MASSFQEEVYDGGYNTNCGGYDVQVIENYPEDFNCGICHLIIKEATHGCLNHVFCKSCLHQHIQHGVRDEGRVMCPGGCKEVVQSDLQISKFANRMINKLKTKCKNDRCQWKGDLLDLVQDHQTNCEYALVSCNNEGCEVIFLKKDSLQHANDCLLQIVECMYCQNHVVKMNKENHEIECSNEKVECNYYDVGCNDKVCRKDVTLHESTHHIKHTRMIYESFKSQQKESTKQITQLKQDNSELKDAFMELEKKSIEQITISNEMIQINANELNQLKDEIENMKEIQVLHENNQQLSNEAQKQNIKLPSETVKLNEETLQHDFNVKAHIIKSLKDRIMQEPELNQWVKLFVDRNVSTVHVELKRNIAMDQLSKCYDNFEFSYVMEQLGLKNYNASMLMKDLFLQIPYHVLYHYEHIYLEKILIATTVYCYTCLPMDSDVVTELRISLKSREFKIQFSKSEFLVESSHGFVKLYLYKEGDCIEIFNGVKVNLQQLEQPEKMNYIFGKTYACLYCSLWCNL